MGLWTLRSALLVNMQSLRSNITSTTLDDIGNFMIYK